MNILDENISLPERDRLLARRIHVRQIGAEIGRLGMKDINEIIPLLHTLRQPTLFTRDHDFYKPSFDILIIVSYCWMWLLMRSPNMSSVCCATPNFALGHNGWAKSFAFAKAGSLTGK